MGLAITVRDGDSVSIGDDVIVQFIRHSQSNTFRLHIVAPNEKQIIRHKTVGLPTPAKKINTKHK